MSDYFDWPLPFESSGLLYLNDAVYSDSTWLTSHNSFVTVDEGWSYHPQQKLNLTSQFHYGVRSFMIDIYKDANQKLIIQHGINFTLPLMNPFGIKGLNFGTNPMFVANYFQEIANLLHNNKEAIITLHVESYVSSVELYSALDATGLTKYLLKENPNDKSLNLGEMRNKNERLVIFSDYGAGHAESRDFGFDDKKKNPFLKGINYVDQYKETEFNLGQFHECEARKDFRAKFNNTSVNLFLLNHFYAKSCAHNYDYSGAASKIVKEPCDLVNSYKKIMERVKKCIQTDNLFPNFVAVDFVEKGDFSGAREVVRTMNIVGKSHMPSYSQEKSHKDHDTKNKEEL
jgi:hypothetical protein